jgi:hypothetical protein
MLFMRKITFQGYFFPVGENFYYYNFGRFW